MLTLWVPASHFQHWPCTWLRSRPSNFIRIALFQVIEKMWYKHVTWTGEPFSHVTNARAVAGSEHNDHDHCYINEPHPPLADHWWLWSHNKKSAQLNRALNERQLCLWPNICVGMKESNNYIILYLAVHVPAAAAHFIPWFGFGLACDSSLILSLP